MSELTVKLRGRTIAAESAEGAQFLSARSAKPQAPHGPSNDCYAANSLPHHLCDFELLANAARRDHPEVDGNRGTIRNE